MINIYFLVIGLIGLVIGGAFCFLLAKSHSQNKINGLEKELASFKIIVEERNNQIKDKDAEIDKLRNELDIERQSRVEASTRREEAEKRLEEQKALIENMKLEMKDTFNALSSAALKSSSEDFLRLASEHLGKVVADTNGKLGEHIKPLQEVLKRYEEGIRLIEESRHKAYGSLEEQLKTLALTHEQLQRETSNLVSALRRPEIRGRWGEITLRRIAELSGMSEHCDFTEQVSVSTESGKLRPDMIVHLPMGREIVVDAKVSLEAYLDAISAQTEQERRLKMKKHSEQIRIHIARLSSKDYWSQFSNSLDFVVLFLPGESFFSAALEIDRSLIEDGIQKGIILTTPTTLIALLKAINYGWREEQLTKNAQVISELGRQLYERMNTFTGYFNDIGSSLTKAITAYNNGISSLEARVLPSIRKFKDLGISVTKEMPIVKQVEKMPKILLLDNPDENKN
ncbi:MAG: DNA recombination protein RmuC [bacterium]